MTPEKPNLVPLVAVAEQRNVRRIVSVGTTMALGRMTDEQLIELDMTLLAREIHPDTPVWQRRQILGDMALVEAEYFRR